MLQKLKNVGPKTTKLLNKLGIYDITDLVDYYPFRYDVMKLTPLIDGDVCINATVESIPVLTYIRKGLTKLSFRVLTDNFLINVTIFNRNFLKHSLKPGMEINLNGKYDTRKNILTCNDIKLKPIYNNEIIPIYHQTKGVNSKLINSIVNEALSQDLTIYDYIPEYLVSKYEFLDKKEALYKIHNPKRVSDAKNAIVRFKYEELFKFMFKINYLKTKREKKGGLKRNINPDKVFEFINDLEFELTKDQTNAVKDIVDDLYKPSRMNRLILGDVGSGKTIVAVCAAYYNYLCGYQSVILAPTEILANQHFINISSMFKKYGISVALLKGKTTKKERTKILEDLKKGDIDLLIGTHAILSDDVVFKNLGFVVTDEQHRFGVNQRKNLSNKGVMCDVLYMSATPIPRTYALTIYGDMDISLIKTKPSGRKEIQTSLIRTKDIKVALNTILEEIKKNHQAYIVCPLIENEDSDLTSVKDLKKKMDIAFNKKIPIEILHGQMKQTEKDSVMKNFKEGKTKILISTTVIEVGVDVFNATLMVIFNAERFGLSTLHQLRGRIGRNNLESKCILISDKRAERLKVLEQSNDGFYISEMDFKLRGEGDLFGVRQSGDMVFKIANISSDIKILTQANIDSKKFISKNIDNDFENYSMYKLLVNDLMHID